MSAGPAKLDRARPPAPGAVRPFRFPPFERLELADGLVLLAARTVAAPLVFFELITPGGARFDPDGKAGLAALTGAMLDEGTPTKSSREIAATAERIGGYLSISADWDSVALETSVASPQAGTALELLGEVVREATLPESELERQRQRALAEIRRRRVMAPILASMQFARALYGPTGFGQPVLGTAASLEALTRADVEGFYRDRVVAAPITLVAAGDLDGDRMGDRVRRAAGGLPRRPPGPPPASPGLDESGVRVFLVDRPAGAQTQLQLGHVGVPRGHPDFIALTVLNSLLGGKFTSRLNLSLRERLGITYGVRSSFSGRAGRGPFKVELAVANDGVARAIAETRAELERLRRERVTVEELEETRSYILGVFPYTVQTLEGICHRLRDLAVHDLPLDYWERYPAQVAAVTADEVLRVAREHLRPDSLTIVAVGPEAELRGQLEPFAEPAVWRPAEQPEPVLPAH